jgi:AcrR family transcriptional regulator
MRSLNASSDHILDAATKAFSHFGFHCTDVEKIAKELGIGKGTIYRRFPTKEKLFLACVERVIIRLYASIEAAIQEEPDGYRRFTTALYAYFSFYEENPEAIELVAQVRSEFWKSCEVMLFRSNELRLWTNILEHLVEDGKVQSERSMQACEYITHLIYGNLISRRFRGNEGLPASEVARAIDFLLFGITGPGDSQVQVDL